MENNSNQYLGEERVGRLMRKYAIPCIISLLVGALYNIVDQIFIANADYLVSFLLQHGFFFFSGKREREQWLVRIKQYLSPGIPATLWVEAVGSIGSLTISG